MSNEEQFKGAFGLIAIWTSWLIGHLAEIQTGVSIMASFAAIIASVFYARYYWLKSKKEK